MSTPPLPWRRTIPITLAVGGLNLAASATAAAVGEIILLVVIVALMVGSAIVAVAMVEMIHGRRQPAPSTAQPAGVEPDTHLSGESTVRLQVMPAPEIVAPHIYRSAATFANARYVPSADQLDRFRRDLVSDFDRVHADAMGRLREQLREDIGDYHDGVEYVVSQLAEALPSQPAPLRRIH